MKLQYYWMKYWKMTKASELVLQAFREINLTPLGKALTPEQAAEGLTLLDRYITSLYGFELGEFKMDWPTPPSPTSPVSARFPLFPANQKLPSDIWPYPPANVNVLLSLVADTTIFLQQNPDDGARVSLINIGGQTVHVLTVDGNGRLVQGASTLSGTSATLNQTKLLYRADLGDWIAIIDMVADTESSPPKEYDTLLELGVADRLAPRHGRSLNRTQQIEFSRLLKRLKAQYRQTVPTPSASPQPFRFPASSSFGANSSSGGDLL